MLKNEPEIWIAYLHGQQFDNLKHLRDRKPRHKGWLLRFMIWGFMLFRDASLQISPKGNQCKFLIYAGTHNQKVALKSTIQALKLKNQNLIAVAPPQIVGEDSNYLPAVLGPKEVLKTLYICSKRVVSMFKVLNRTNPLLLRNSFDKFLKIYQDLAYFDKLLTQLNPQYIIVSNDHNIDNRVLLALARQQEIITVYMQHASVTSLFPALNFDYAFLDGQSALDAYKKCENNHPNIEPLCARRKVVLSGQKKNISYNKRAESNLVGLALNTLDRLCDVKLLLDFITDSGFVVKLRWHPGLVDKEVLELKRTTKNALVQYSEPVSESLSDFFSSINCLIAGNSSIHLEAALSRIPAIYYEITEASFQDYYGYVKNKVSFNAKTPEELISLLAKSRDNELSLSTEGIQYYSATYGTEWEGNEGELVAKILVDSEVIAGFMVKELREF